MGVPSGGDGYPTQQAHMWPSLPPSLIAANTELRSKVSRHLLAVALASCAAAVHGASPAGHQAREAG